MMAATMPVRVNVTMQDMSVHLSASLRPAVSAYVV
jgi:hypothetical protein